MHLIIFIPITISYAHCLILSQLSTFNMHCISLPDFHSQLLMYTCASSNMLTSTTFLLCILTIPLLHLSTQLLHIYTLTCHTLLHPFAQPTHMCTQITTQLMHIYTLTCHTLLHPCAQPTHMCIQITPKISQSQPYNQYVQYTQYTKYSSSMPVVTQLTHSNGHTHVYMSFQNHTQKSIHSNSNTHAHIKITH